MKRRYSAESARNYREKVIS